MAVFGVGGVGLNVVQGGALVAAHPIIAVDTVAAKLDHAAAIGATHGVDASRGGSRGRHPPHHRPRRRLRLRGGGRHAAHHPGPGGAGAGRHLRAHRGARDRRHRAAGRPPARDGGACDPRLVSYGSARTREDLPAMVQALSGGPAAHRRADHPALRARRGQRGLSRPRRRRAGSRRSSSSERMREIVFALEFRGRAGAEPGAPHLAARAAPRRARPCAPSSARAASPSAMEPLAGEAAVLDSRVERFSDGTFVEDGTITYGSAGAITFVTMGRGHVGPSAAAGLGTRRGDLGGHRRQRPLRGRARSRHVVVHGGPRQ